MQKKCFTSAKEHHCDRLCWRGALTLWPFTAARHVSVWVKTNGFNFLNGFFVTRHQVWFFLIFPSLFSKLNYCWCKLRNGDVTLWHSIWNKDISNNPLDQLQEGSHQVKSTKSVHDQNVSCACSFFFHTSNWFRALREYFFLSHFKPSKRTFCFDW